MIIYDYYDDYDDDDDDDDDDDYYYYYYCIAFDEGERFLISWVSCER